MPVRRGVLAARIRPPQHFLNRMIEHLDEGLDHLQQEFADSALGPDALPEGIRAELCGRLREAVAATVSCVVRDGE